MAGMPVFVPPVVPAGRMGDQPQPTLSIDDLALRPWQSSDVDVIVDAYTDPAIQRWHVRSMTEAEAAHWVNERAERWKTEKGADWAIVDQADGGVLGRIGTRVLELPEGWGEAAYWVRPQARGRNVAARALNTMSDWLFHGVGLHRVELEHSTANAPSCRVADKAGFLAEGTRRQQVLHTDGWHDMHLHARLSTDS